MKTVFEKIRDRELPANIVAETDDWLAFHDLHPAAPVHILIVPKRHIERLGQTKGDDTLLLGTLLRACAEVAAQIGIKESGFRVVINNGPDGGETIPHLHLHLLGGRALHWPPG
jgi:histidine triad (HIT) family protein